MKHRKILWIAALALALMCIAVMLLPKIERYFALRIDTDGTDYAVVLNKYAREDWNGHYGHCDLTIQAPRGAELSFEVNGEPVRCESITLSYGPTDGDCSPARVNLYTSFREDHTPIDRAVISDDLTEDEFARFMAWLDGEFAAFSAVKKKYLQYAVLDGEFGIYSVVDEKNCVTAALYMLENIPGVLEEAGDEALDVIRRVETYFATHDYDPPIQG